MTSRCDQGCQCRCADLQLLSVGGAADAGCSPHEPAVPERAGPQHSISRPAAAGASIQSCSTAGAGSTGASRAVWPLPPTMCKTACPPVLSRSQQRDMPRQADVETRKRHRNLNHHAMQSGGRTGVEGPGLTRMQRVAYGLLILVRYAWGRAGTIVARQAVSVHMQRSQAFTSLKNSWLGSNLAPTACCRAAEQPVGIPHVLQACMCIRTCR